MYIYINSYICSEKTGSWTNTCATRSWDGFFGKHGDYLGLDVSTSTCAWFLSMKHAEKNKQTAFWDERHPSTLHFMWARTHIIKSNIYFWKPTVNHTRPVDSFNGVQNGSPFKQNPILLGFFLDHCLSIVLPSNALGTRLFFIQSKYIYIYIRE